MGSTQGLYGIAEGLRGNSFFLRAVDAMGGLSVGEAGWSKAPWGKEGWLPGVTETPSPHPPDSSPPPWLAFKVRNSIPGRLSRLAGLAPTKAALKLTCSLTESGVPPAWPAARA